MTEFPYAELETFLERVESSYSGIESTSDLFRATVALAAELLGTDVCIIAEKDNGGLAPLVSHPSEWADSDGLLSPASLPSVIASQGISYLVADRSDTRGATETESLPKASSITYKSLLVVPIGAERVLIAGSQETSAFSETDLKCLRLIGQIATTLKDVLKAPADGDMSQERVGATAAHLSHDAKNFLSIIRGRVELARENPQSEHFDAIERASQRVIELIDDTRTFLESGTSLPDLEPVQLNEVVQESWEVEATDQAKILMSPLDTVLAERSQLLQLLENLFRNAIDHAGPEVAVWVGMLSGEEGFYVEDDGPGIDRSERESVFDFAYAEAEGSGLGLNIVQRIAAAHGWDISIERGEMNGTRFEIAGVEFPE